MFLIYYFITLEAFVIIFKVFLLWFVAGPRFERISYTFYNVCPFLYTVFTVSGKVRSR